MGHRWEGEAQEGRGLGGSGEGREETEEGLAGRHRLGTRDYL